MSPREILPTPFTIPFWLQLVNSIMLDGKRAGVARQKVVYGAFESLKKSSAKTAEVFQQAMENVMPAGGQVPPRRRRHLSGAD